MTVEYRPVNRDPSLHPPLAIVARISSKQGLSVHYTGVKNFDLRATSIEKLVEQLRKPGFPWKTPKFGKMKSALTLNVPEPLVALIFVLEKSLDAEFSASLPPFFAADEASSNALFNAQVWPGSDKRPDIGSVMVKLDRPGDVSFNIGLDSVCDVGGEICRTPIIIDPEIPWPPTGGGMGGGAPPP